MGHNDVLDDAFREALFKAITDFLDPQSGGILEKIPTRFDSNHGPRVLIADFDGLCRAPTVSGEEVIRFWTVTQRDAHLQTLGTILQSLTADTHQISDESATDSDEVFGRVK